MKHWIFGASGLVLGIILGAAVGLLSTQSVADITPGEIAEHERINDQGADQSPKLEQDMEPNGKQTKVSNVEGNSQAIDYASLGSKVRIIGQLGVPLLHLLRIEGTRFVHGDDEPRPKAADSEIYFDVDRVNDRKLNNPVTILLNRNYPKRIVELPPGEPMVLEGYEDGAFSGLFDLEGDSGGKYRDSVPRAGWARHFAVKFVVLDAWPANRQENPDR